MGRNGKFSSLSLELSRARALVGGGGAPETALAQLRRWSAQAPARGSSRVATAIVGWNARICSALRDALPLGAPVGMLLREVQPMVRREERQWARLSGVERQFGFQGAVAVVLPWAVAALACGIELNALTFAGTAFQVAGLAFFYVLIRRATREPDPERAWVFELLVAMWLRVLAGMSLHAALDLALRVQPERDGLRGDWRRWLEAYDSGALAKERAFEWGPSRELSRETALGLRDQLASGTPAAAFLAELIGQLDDERQAQLEERLGGIPARLSLLFCAFFAPAVFLIFMGGLWPMLSQTGF